MERCLLNDLLWMLALQFQLCIKYKMIHIFLFSRNFDAMLNGLKLPCRRKGFRTTKCRGAGEILPRPLASSVSSVELRPGIFSPFPTDSSQCRRHEEKCRYQFRSEIEPSLFRFRLRRSRRSSSSVPQDGLFRGRDSARGYVPPRSRASGYALRSR